MATIVNARDVLLQAASTRLESVTFDSNLLLNFANVTGATKPSNNADVTVTAVNGGVTVTGGGITLSGGGAIKGGQTGYDTGTGWFLGYSGGAYKFSIGNASGNKMTWDGSTLGIVGAITGTSSIDISGTAYFGGAVTSGSATFAAVFNNGYAADYGALGRASVGAGLRGEGNGGTSTNTGVQGLQTGTQGRGVHGLATDNGGGGVGVRAEHAYGGTALQVIGPMTIDNSTLVSGLNAEKWNGATLGTIGTGASTATPSLTNKPGSSSTGTWAYITSGGVNYYFQVYT